MTHNSILARGDRGSQLTSSNNYVTWTVKEDPGSWNWDKVVEKSAGTGTVWEFVLAGCQDRNGLAESRVKVVKANLGHIMASTVIGGKPTLHYAELCTLLAQVADIVNDRPAGVRSLTEEDIIPITANQLLLGRTSTSTPGAQVEVEQNFVATSRFQEELLNSWWNLWRVQAYPHLLPYQRFKDASRQKNLQVGDVCLVKYDNKVKATYRLCFVKKVFLSNGGVVRTGEVGYRPRQLCGPDRATKRAPLEILPVGVQRLVLICPAEELPGEASEEVPGPERGNSGEHGHSSERGHSGQASQGLPAEASSAEALEAAEATGGVPGEALEEVPAEASDAAGEITAKTE